MGRLMKFWKLWIGVSRQIMSVDIEERRTEDRSLWNSCRDCLIFTQRITNPHLEGSPCEEQLYSVVQVFGDVRLI